jgi:enoyl-CoA hydratase/carnithine racemase
VADFRLERDGGVWSFVIDREAQRNALSWEVRNGLLATLAAAEAAGDCSALVITGAGEKAFCAGGDVQGFSKELETLDETWPGEPMARLRSLGHIAQHIITSPVVVISAVNGAAFGGGCSLALAADIVVAHRRARFGFGFVRRGLVPDWGGFYTLPRLVGMARAKSLVLRGTTLSAEEAHRMGMIAELTDGDTLAEAQAIAREIAAGPRIAQGMAKLSLGRSFETSIDGMMSYELLNQTIACRTADFREGVESFLQKREPVFNRR